MFSRRQLAAYLGEFLGTAGLTLSVLAVAKSNLGSLPFFVAMATGLATTVLVFVFSSGNSYAQLNPAVTLGLWTIRRVKSLEAILNIALQLLGGFAALSLFTYFVNTTIPTSNLEFTGRVMVAEAVGTFILAFGWAAALYNGYRGLALGASVGLATLAGMVVATSASAALLNPAVALGVNQWEWGTYVLGPVLGALIGFNLYSLLFAAPEKVVAVAAETAVVSEAPVATKTTVDKKPVAAKKAAKTPAVKKTTSRPKRTTKR
ncbi:MAG: major intrinsic protein [Candidatus Saccharibacteria bacterium]|nr:major intrinsic protein [Candidatus Saccharibacteria bacterium]